MWTRLLRWLYHLIGPVDWTVCVACGKKFPVQKAESEECPFVKVHESFPNGCPWCKGTGKLRRPVVMFCSPECYRKFMEEG